MSIEEAHIAYPVKVNGRLMDVLLPECDLRQKDLVSQYLFIMSNDDFSTLRHHSEIDGTNKGVQMCNEAPKINHLFFVDYYLIIVKSSATVVVRMATGDSSI